MVYQESKESQHGFGELDIILAYPGDNHAAHNA